MNLKKKVSMRLIGIARRLFSNTPLQRWAFTSWVYGKVFHFGYNESQVRVEYFGVSLDIPTKDITIVPGLVGGFYEKTELSIFQEICKNSKTIVDVGGNIGLYTCVGASAVKENKGSRIYSFEPVKENLNYLYKNIKTNNLEKYVTVSTNAVGQISGETKIYITENNIGTHSLSQTNADSKKFEKVKVTTIDVEFANIKVDVLKIDVEGYDGFVLNGATNMLKKFMPTLFLELVPNHLIASGYKPKDFVNIISMYKSIYIVEEIHGKVQKVVANDLLRFVDSNHNTNIIAINQKAHDESIKKFL